MRSPEIGNTNAFCANLIVTRGGCRSSVATVIAATLGVLQWRTRIYVDATVTVERE
jgi:hypothetical protein